MMTLSVADLEEIGRTVDELQAISATVREVVAAGHVVHLARSAEGVYQIRGIEAQAEAPRAATYRRR